MMRRWPIRVRLTAAFTAVMALVLLAVATFTVAHAKESLDAAITESLSHQLADLRPTATGAEPVLAGGDPDTAQLVIAPDGQVLAATPNLAGQTSLSPSELNTAQRGQLVADHTRLGNLEGPVRVAARPVPGERVVVAAESLADRDAAVADLRNELAIGFPIVLLAAAVGAYLLAAAALRPVERMRARAAGISATDAHARLPIPSARDEIQRLVTTFNELLQRLRDALERERRFVTDAGHELRTPLSLLTTELELALRRPRSIPDLIASLRSAFDETTRLSRLARDLLTVADASRPAETPTIDVRTHLEAIADRYRHSLGDQLTVDCPAGQHVRADPADLDRIISNLIDNAAQHGAPPITIHAQRATGDGVEIRVRDHGPGLDPTFLPHAFDRFTRADAARTTGGTGLGLAIVDTLSQRNHGTVTAHNHHVAAPNSPFICQPHPRSPRELRTRTSDRLGPGRHRFTFCGLDTMAETLIVAVRPRAGQRMRRGHALPRKPWRAGLFAVPRRCAVCFRSSCCANWRTSHRRRYPLAKCRWRRRSPRA